MGYAVVPGFSGLRPKMVLFLEGLARPNALNRLLGLVQAFSMNLFVAYRKKI